ncbi:calpain-like cysteine peptidase, Clan CA, family C2 [Trypanosoma grayi]|uniref:calpain-like cysteine peptidase, Clan CA, family C2 n=1 Tax=Trypanosoma grayi TaxID=71804 RepID=UPI0004F47ABF|nr:calpain-like cysteine peptidase, Clan CA, family C2 [Trypanosoma grayi]KEG06776.1 calpain-like cysteine peptidase, Clan CA, family C2 [Trypanosoma grayi]
MGSGSSKPKDRPITGSPAMHGKRTALFNGLLYRIIDDSTGTWGFYNNSQDYEFYVMYLFDIGSTIQPLNQTSMVEQDDGFLCEVAVLPSETQRFIVGDVTGYESKIEARPLADEYFQSHPFLDERDYYRRVAAPRAAAF